MSCSEGGARGLYADEKRELLRCFACTMLSHCLLLLFPINALCTVLQVSIDMGDMISYGAISCSFDIAYYNYCERYNN